MPGGGAAGGRECWGGCGGLPLRAAARRSTLSCVGGPGVRAPLRRWGSDPGDPARPDPTRRGKPGPALRAIMAVPVGALPPAAAGLGPVVAGRCWGRARPRGFVGGGGGRGKPRCRLVCFTPPFPPLLSRGPSGVVVRLGATSSGPPLPASAAAARPEPPAPPGLGGGGV